MITLLNTPKLISLHSVKWFQAFQSNTSNSFYYQSFIGAHLNGWVWWHINHRCFFFFHVKSCFCVYISLVWFGFVLWHINHFRLFNAKSSSYIYIKYIGFGLVWFYGISIIVDYWMPKHLYTNILNIYDFVWFGLVLWQINHCWLFNATTSLYIYIKYIWFVLVWFYGISTSLGYFMPNPF